MENIISILWTFSIIIFVLYSNPHSISKTIKFISTVLCMFISLQCIFSTHQCWNKHQKWRFWEMKISNHFINYAKFPSRKNKKLSFTHNTILLKCYIMNIFFIVRWLNIGSKRFSKVESFNTWKYWFLFTGR